MPVADLLPKFLAGERYLWVAIKFVSATLGFFLMPGLQWKRLAGGSNVLPELFHDAKLIGDRQFSELFQFD
jgi:hypothetical protein